MAQRIKIGIPFNYNENWIGGTYYIVNLIKAINLLDDEEKPIIVIYYKEDKERQLVYEINYPYIEFEKYKSVTAYNIIQRVFNKIYRIFFHKNIFENRPKQKDIDFLFPANNKSYFELILDKQKLFWIPDFQEHFLPEFFTKEEIEGRKKYQKKLIDRNVKIIFSSNNAFNNFKQIYPDSKNKTSVMQFAVSTEEEYKKIELEKILDKFNLPQKYFICSNQFWAHKNHITVLKALKILKQKQIKLHVVFTGKTTDYRNPNFYQSLLNFVNKEQLNEYVSFLGFIDRTEQLKLMSEAIAVIQPSLFEGWGTVVEDAKSMNKYIILSDIAVHKEQSTENMIFFEKQNATQLSKIIETFNNKDFSMKELDYKKNQIKFAQNFIKVCQNFQ